MPKHRRLYFVHSFFVLVTGHLDWHPITLAEVMELEGLPSPGVCPCRRGQLRHPASLAHSEEMTETRLINSAVPWEKNNSEMVETEGAH